MKEISLKISDIDCAACVERLNRAISAVNGVRAAAVNYASGRALISYDEDETSIASIAAAVKKAGFGVPADSVELKCPALDAETMSRALAALRAMEEVQSAEQNAETGSILVRVWPVNPDSRRLARGAARGRCVGGAGRDDQR
ncbi:MAG: heavy-metal-associated domain-containing protein [Oscillospiraceae bacterium]